MADQNAQSKLSIDVLLKEYDRVCNEIRSIESSNEKAVGFGLTIVGAGFAYGIQQNALEIFYFLPVALVMVVCYAILHQSYVFWFGGYKRALEEKLNLLIGDRVLAWERIVAEHRGHRNLINCTILFLYGTIFATVFVYCVYEIYQHNGGELAGACAILLAEFIGVTSLCFLQMMRVYNVSYGAARTFFGLPPL
jgi:hypothetical protein